MAIVSTSVAAIPEIVRHSDTGLTVPTGDAGALTAALRDLADEFGSSPELRRTGSELCDPQLRRPHKCRPPARIAQVRGRRRSPKSLEAVG